MRKANFHHLLALLMLVGLVFGFADELPDQPETNPGTESPEAIRAFDQMMAVLTHKRCVNCHPSGDRPRQGEDSHLHYFNVQRGPDGHGLAALQCSTCHQETNNYQSGVPGAPHWHLAPRSMAWEGLSAIEIAESMLDPARNGNRSLDDIVHHLTEDELVLWAFEPGVDHEGNPREKPPVSKEDFIQAVKDWAAAGAPIPAE
jgi:hypothetical protein